MFEWDLPNHYAHQVQSYGGYLEEVIYTPAEQRLRTGDHPDCWSFTSPPKQDDAFEPRLDLSEWNVPPATKTAWRVAYSPAEPQPDGSTLVRWTGFVADGTALIGADGLLRGVSFEDHHMARGRTSFKSMAITFTGFPAAITPVQAVPSCSADLYGLRRG